MIYTNEDAFTVSGDITSLYGNVGLKINGNQLLYPAGDLNVLAEPITQVFSYGAQLQEGENVVTVEFTDEATGASATVTFTVVKDTAAPEAPVIAQGGDGNVTLTAAEEDVYPPQKAPAAPTVSSRSLFACTWRRLSPEASPIKR